MFQITLLSTTNAGYAGSSAARRGRPVKKPRFIPAPLAYELARRLHARRLGTISVI